ncbi:MAG TPA: TIR domain-containing protein [Pyrinomonadaceae bacterium]|nr:TIR domain-containing protein [Pyrinomonadaceae bacterium]
MTKPKRTGIFISYSRSDKDWLDLLKLHLNRYVQVPQASYWDDTQIKAGEKWFDEIAEALASAKIAVLLVSETFLTSPFIGKHEVPVIREAFQSGEMTIFWIPIGSSGYKNTWLVDHQAAHNPELPLKSLSHWEAAKVLEELCKQLRGMVNEGADEVLLPQPSKMTTRYEVIRCNRSHYLNRYANFLHASLKDRPRLPQVCIVFGKMGQSHDTLIERMHREVIKPLADTESNTSLQRGVLHKKSEADWPDPLGNIDAQKEDLQIELSLEYTGDRPYPPAFPAEVFTKLPQLSNYRFVTVQHLIHLGEGAGSDWAAIAELLKWYLQTYWGQFAKTLEHENGNSARPQFLIFIKISYETPGLLNRILTWMSARFDNDVVKGELAQIVEEADKSFPCLLLDELITPTPIEVVRWYTDNSIYDTEHDRVEAVTKLYDTHGEQLSMAIIEKELANCLRPVR